MRRPAIAIALALAFGCGPPGPTATPRDDGACDAARLDAERAWREVAVAAQAAAAPPDVDAPAATAALARLEAHVVELAEAPREITGDEALTLSNAMMDGIDELGPDLDDTRRERADLAAEALLTDRGRDGSLRAARAALVMLEQAIVAARPSSAGSLERRRDATELSIRATRAAEAYESGVADGDRMADRAEAAPLGESAGELQTLRDAATSASRDARQSCGVPRTLAAPAI